MWNQKIGALVLAAGYSSRMEDFKSLLPFAGFTVIEKVIYMFRDAGIRDIRVVVGHRAEELIPLLDSLGVRHIFNEQYDAGMFSSIVKGVQSFQGETEGLFLIPGDMPLVKSHTVRVLGRVFNGEMADIIYPVFQKLRGHPPLISANCFSKILLGNGIGGLCQILEQYEGKAYELEVLDEGILLDLDTQEDYQKLNTENYSRGIPTQAECDAFLARMKVSESIVNHGRVVADVSRKLALQLNQVGLSIDVNAVVAAGKLHDVAKGQPDHARVGARMLKKYGYYKVAQIVAAHTDILLKEERSPDEAAVVYLADKLVKGECIVSIEERFSSSLDKYSGDTEAAAAVIKRRLQAQQIEKNVEQLLGMSVKKVIADQSYL